MMACWRFFYYCTLLISVCIVTSYGSRIWERGFGVWMPEFQNKLQHEIFCCLFWWCVYSCRQLTHLGSFNWWFACSTFSIREHNSIQLLQIPSNQIAHVHPTHINTHTQIATKLCYCTHKHVHLCVCALLCVCMCHSGSTSIHNIHLRVLVRVHYM